MMSLTGDASISIGCRNSDLKYPRCNESVSFTQNLHQEAAVSIINFAMFAVRNTSYLDPERGVRGPISVLATDRAMCSMVNEPSDRYRPRNV
jgi:hypothetical protein